MFQQDSSLTNNGNEHLFPAEDISDFGNFSDPTLISKLLIKKLIEPTSKLQQDPTSPLYSVKSFQNLRLKPNLLKGVYSMGFTAPSKIQETALPVLLADEPHNLIAQSQSGTGKTAAFALAMLSRVNTSLDYPHVLCISPTYELAIQIGEIVAKMGQYCPDIKIRFAVRGEEVTRNSNITEHIIIGTPGKILDWGTKLKFFDLEKITVFVLDEADVMIAIQGHQDQILRIHRKLSSNCQMLFFSATYQQDIIDFAELIVPNPIVIRLPRKEECLDNIKQYYCRCNNEEEKYNAIVNIYNGVTIGQAIIFCSTRIRAHWLASKMSGDGHMVAVLSGDLTVEQRLAVLDRFRANQEKVLIATNVLSRGIDIEQVTIVINFDMPVDVHGKTDPDTYLHRIGRTGRFGKAGIALNLLDSDKNMQMCKEIEVHFGREIRHINTEQYEEVEKLNN